MGIAVSIIGFSYGAILVWLVVRVANRRQRWAKWTLVTVIGLPVLYIASLGPACRVTATPWIGRGIPFGQIRQPVWMNMYRPICWLSDRYDGSFYSEAILHYVQFSIPRNSLVAVLMDSADENRLWIVAK
jgi:hypothetical protein